MSTDYAEATFKGFGSYTPGTHTHTTEKACHLSTAHQPPYSRAFNHDAVGMDASGPPYHPRLITQTFNPGQTNATQTGTKTVI